MNMLFAIIKQYESKEWQQKEYMRVHVSICVEIELNEHYNSLFDEIGEKHRNSF